MILGCWKMKFSEDLRGRLISQSFCVCVYLWKDLYSDRYPNIKDLLTWKVLILQHVCCGELSVYTVVQIISTAQELSSSLGSEWVDVFISGMAASKLELYLTAVLLGINLRLPPSSIIVPYLNVRLVHWSLCIEGFDGKKISQMGVLFKWLCCLVVL